MRSRETKRARDLLDRIFRQDASLHVVNVSDGGGFYNYERIKESLKNRPPLTQEARKKISEKATGRFVSFETRMNMSEACKNKQFSDEHRKHISEAKKGKVFSDEHRKKLSLAQKARRAKEITEPSAM